MTFSVNINGKALSDGVSVFPFSFGQLLDERLDEAYLHITKSATPVYKPTTEVRVDLQEGNATVKQFYFIVAKDNAYELPVGSGKYRHDIHLIERTKLLEGIYCQSITFTNSIGNNYTANASVSIPYAFYFPYSGDAPSVFFEGFMNVKSPVLTGASVNLPTAREAAENENVRRCLASTDSGLNWDRLIPMEEYGQEKTSVTIQKINGDPIVKYWDENANTLADKSFFATYYLVYKNDQTSGLFAIRFTIEIFATDNTFPLKPLTVTDCINRVLDLAEPRFGGTPYEKDSPTSAFWGDSPRYFLNADQADEFEKILAPEFTMTQCTLREQLKVIGGFIHGEPRLRPSGEIYYEMYGNTTESAEIDAQTPYVYRGVSHDISQYCTQIDTSASNIVNALNYAQGVVFSPDRKNYRTVRTESVNIRVTETNANVRTTFPIQDVTEVKCGLYGEDGEWLIDPVDITPYVFTEADYNSRLSSFEANYPRSKSFAIYYAIGQRDLRGIFFKADEEGWAQLYPYLATYSIINILAAASGRSPSEVKGMTNSRYIDRLAFSVSYIPIYNTRFSHGKQMVEDGTEYTQIYNQQENLIETRYYGENVKGVAARLGNVEQTRTYIFKSLSQIPKAGQMLNVGTEDEPDYYAISAVNTEILPTYYKTTVALTKDFNRISEYVGISSNKRVYEVSEREAYARNILLKEYAIVGRKPRNGYSYTPGIFRDPWGIASAFNPSIKDTAGNEASPISTAICWGGTAKNPFSKSATVGYPPLAMVSLPVISSAFGNSMVFSWGYKDNYSAGERVSYQQDGSVSGWWQQDVAYGDLYGKMYYYNFFLLTANNTPNLGKDLALSSPYVPSQPVNSSNEADFRREKSNIKTEAYKPYRIRKDSREILNFNFEIEFKSNCKNLIIGSGLASASRLVSAIEGGYAVIYRFRDEYGRVGKFDRQFIPPLGLNGSPIPGMQISVDGNTIKIPLPEETKYSKHWVITTPYTAGTPYEVEDEQGNVKTYTPHTGGEILLACDNPYELYKELGGNTIYINLSKTQKEE